MSLAPYPDYASLVDGLSKHGRVETYGHSVEDRPLVRVDVGGTGPRVVVTAGLHGLEYIGVMTALTVLESGPIPGARLSVYPVLNPDGYARTWSESGRGRVRDFRKNARGVDLNRNFPMPYSQRPTRVPFAGGSHPDSATYRGPRPLSEPETQALAADLLDDPPHASVNLHSFMGTLICARVWERADWDGYTALVQAFRAAQHGARYPRLGSRFFDVFTGELEDWQHHVLGCWAVCVESFTVFESFAAHLRAPSAFARFNPSDPGPIAQRDAPAVRAFLERSLELSRPAIRPGAANCLPTWETI